MNISAVTSVASVFEGSRVAGQQAVATTPASQTDRENDRKASEADVKKTDVVSENGESGASGETGHRRVNILT